MHNKKAFSLFELSITVSVIIIMLGVILSGKGLISKARIARAITATVSSPVKDTKNLALWYETTLNDSFVISPGNGDSIAQWNDLDNQTLNARNATASGAGQPTYIKGAINGLPVLRFNGSSNVFNFDGSFLINSDYTIFVVEQRRSSASSNYFVGGGTASANCALHLGYRADTAITHAQYNNDYDMTITAYSSPIPRIHVFINNIATGKKYYLNGGVLTGSSVNTTPLGTCYTNAKIGQNSVSNYFNGDIGEIIMFNRALSDNERKAVELYLSKKWSIKLS